MYRQASSSPDKTIVERRVAHKGDKSRKAVKDLRSGLMGNSSPSSPIQPSFELEVLQRHSQAQTISIFANLVIVALTAYLLHSFVSPSFSTVWLAVIVLIGGITMICAKRFQSSNPVRPAIKKWQVTFQSIALTWGVCWASAFAASCLLKPQLVSVAPAFASILVVTILAFVNSRFLKHGVLLSALPVALIVSGWMVADGKPSSIAYAMLMIVIIFCFQRFGSHVRHALLDQLNSKAERDQLVMELDASRAISDEARRRAEDANLAKSRFLATMSHELRTPLNAILGFSEVMSNEVMGPLNNEYYKEYVGDIHRSGAHLLKLINEILDLSRVEAGRYELNEEATNLAHAAEESHQMVKLKAEEKNVAVIMQIQPDLPQIWADARAIRQVILNLLSNALKFTPSGGSIHVKVGWTAGGGQYVSIRDTGPGIPEEEIPIVLSSFGQGSIAIKSAEQGTGLGLPIVQALVHMHDGKFELKSKLRVGTEVIATFPRARVMEVLSAVAVEAPSSNPAPVARKFSQPLQKVQAPTMGG